MSHANCRRAPNSLLIQFQLSTTLSLEATSVHSASLVSTYTHVSLRFYVYQITAFFLSSKVYHICYISGSRSGVSDDSLLLGCESLSMWAVTDISNVCNVSFPMVKMERNKWIKIQNGRSYFTWQLPLVTYRRYIAQHMCGRLSGKGGVISEPTGSGNHSCHIKYQHQN